MKNNSSDCLVSHVRPHLIGEYNGGYLHSNLGVTNPAETFFVEHGTSFTTLEPGLILTEPRGFLLYDFIIHLIQTQSSSTASSFCIVME